MTLQRPSGSSAPKNIYQKLYHTFGEQHWWPGETPFEVAVGAILTQNTAWANASHAIEELKRAGLLEPHLISRVSQKRLADLIHSSGFFNQKARRLKIFSRHLIKNYHGDLARMKRVPTDVLRRELLSLSGIGPETADSILLYALEKPVFVVDAYTRRVLARHRLISWEASYEEIQSHFMAHLPKSPKLFNEYHALLVALGKNLCTKRAPSCHPCPLRGVGRLKLEPGCVRNPHRYSRLDPLPCIR